MSAAEASGGRRDVGARRSVGPRRAAAIVPGFLANAIGDKALNETTRLHRETSAPKGARRPTPDANASAEEVRSTAA
jgi:hypothetical protein